MADKAPVQDKLSKILAEMLWCLAGTEEEDEYAGQVYLEMEGEEYGDDDDCFDDDDDVDEDEDEDEDGMHDGVIEDADGDTMEIIEMEESSDDGDEKLTSYNDDVDVEEDEEIDDEEDEEEQRIKDMNEKHCRGAHLVSLFISTFLCTMRREWGNVDKHRVDKFYTAVRLMISEVS